jgi:hypothetical protein
MFSSQSNIFPRVAFLYQLMRSVRIVLRELLQCKVDGFGNSRWIRRRKLNKRLSINFFPYSFKADTLLE